MFVRLAGAAALVTALATAAGAAFAERVDLGRSYDASRRLDWPWVSYEQDNDYIVVSPWGGPPGSTVTVVAGGLRPYERVQLGVSDGTLSFRRLAHARADASGRVVAELVVPRDRDRDGRLRFVATTPAGRVLARSRYFAVAVDPIWRGGPAAGRRFY